MPDDQHDLTDDEREFLRRSGFDPARHQAIRDTPTALGGGRSVEAISRALLASQRAKEDRRDD